MKKRRFAALLSFFALLFILLSLAGCDRSGSSTIFRCDIEEGIDNLDPQYATDSAARMIIRNIYEGLVVLGPDGTLQPGAAESWEISSDEQAYTFTLREGLAWSGSNATPLTADDFRYAFERLFNPSSPSPHADQYKAIQNAAEMMAGLATAGDLGIHAQGRQLTILLDHPDPQFLQRLADTPAMPCNREFFLGCRGRYGLEREFLLCNGPFAMTRWDNERSLSLRQNGNYRSERATRLEGVDIYIGRGNPATLLDDGRTDVALIPASKAGAMERGGNTVTWFDQTVWCAAFSTKNPVWGNVMLRQAIAACTDRALLEGLLADGYTPTDRILAPSLMLVGEPWESYSALTRLVPFDEDLAHEYFSRGLQVLELDAMPQVELLIPDSDEHALYVGYIQQGWQRVLSTYPNVQRLDEDTLNARWKSGDYDIMLVAFPSSSSQVGEVLEEFRGSGAGGGFGGYSSAIFDQMLDNALAAGTAENAARSYAQAESQLLHDAVLIPLYAQRSGYAVAKDWQDLWIYPQDGSFYFKYANKAG